MEKVMNFIIQRQEAFAHNMEVEQADTRQLKQTVAQLMSVVGELVDAQQKFLQSQERTQNDISNVLKITTGLFEIVMKKDGA